MKKFRDSFVKECASAEFADVCKEFSADVDNEKTLNLILKRQAAAEERENKEALKKEKAKSK